MAFLLRGTLRFHRGTAFLCVIAPLREDQIPNCRSRQDAKIIQATEVRHGAPQPSSMEPRANPAVACRVGAGLAPDAPHRPVHGEYPNIRLATFGGHESEPFSAQL